MKLSHLSTGNIYTHAGNYFSKLLLLEATRLRYNEDICIIVQDEKILKKYLWLAKSLAIPIRRLIHLQDLDDIWKHLSSTSLWCITESELYRRVPEKLKHHELRLELRESYTMEYIIWKLVDLWYEQSEFDTPWTYSRLWDTVTIRKESGSEFALRFWWDELEEIESQGVQLPSLSLYSRKDINIHEDTHTTYTTLETILASKEHLILLGDNLSVSRREENFHVFKKYIALDILWEFHESVSVLRLPYVRPECRNLEELKKILTDSTYTTYIYTKHSKLISEFISLNTIKNVQLIQLDHPLSESFQIDTTRILCDDILASLFIRRRKNKKLSQDIDLLLSISEDDYVVHRDHGIGVYKGITHKDIPHWNGLALIKEYLEIHYQCDEKLFVPITELSRITKYVWPENPKLHPLRWKAWQKKIQKIETDIQQTAQELLKTFALRKMRAWNILHYNRDSLNAFQASFLYSYTPDQQNAIDDIQQDLQSEKNMDRLIVWDVWFWKTEIAFVSAYTAVLAGKQVAFISPLVVLAHEHYSKALERFTWLWLRIAILTRLQSSREIQKTLRDLENWEIDIVIWTHRLLSEDIHYQKLWLLIVDEEHKFGVRDKEKIKELKANIDILSLSATPIPRSLNLALSGVRDISLLKTAPAGRKWVETYVSRYNEDLIVQAGLREFARGGQIFFIHNRVTTIEVYKKELESLFPRKKVVTLHGQMNWDEIEDRIIDFKNRKYDILLSTTVIENGIDFSNVNTIFINECQQFGISQIHQLRGRVGRSNEQAYCYLLYKKQELDSDAAKRLQTIVDYSYLWAGFELAMKDLEVRGWGDILWVKQSGQGKEIGMSLFLKLLEDAITKLRNSWESWTHSDRKVKTLIDLPINTYISEEYFMTESDKLNFYREIESLESLEELKTLKRDFIGDEETKENKALYQFFTITELSLLASDFHISRIRKVGVYYTLDFHADTQLENLKHILQYDTKMYLQVVNSEKMRAEVKHFTSDVLFIQYLLDVLRGKKLQTRKIVRKIW